MLYYDTKIEIIEWSYFSINMYFLTLKMFKNLKVDNRNNNRL